MGENEPQATSRSGVLEGSSITLFRRCSGKTYDSSTGVDVEPLSEVDEEEEDEPFASWSPFARSGEESVSVMVDGVLILTTAG